MMFIHTLEVAGINSAISGMRNPMNSWGQSDTTKLGLGDKDLELAKSLIKAGNEHSKFMRQIQVWVNINMPRYWWQEFDTYHFNTKNSCSTMHKICSREITLDDFEYDSSIALVLLDIIYGLNILRHEYLLTKDYKCVILMKQLLPESYLQLRTVNTNYAELRTIYHQRKNHKLKKEWVDTFCKWVETLPYAKELITDGKIL